ncbi:MAG: SIS domain-containing protein [Blastocatellia bacterium]
MAQSRVETEREMADFEEQVRAMAAESLAAKREFFDAHAGAVARAAGHIIDALRGGGKLMLFGNGGSAADAQHIAAELAFRMVRDRDPIPAIALTTDSSLLTAISNDSGFDQVFARQIRALGRRGDAALAISTSGNSANVVEAVRQARAMEIRTIGLLGRDGGKLAELVDLPLIVSHRDTQRIQEAHITIAHILCQLVEDDLHPAQP